MNGLSDLFLSEIPTVFKILEWLGCERVIRRYERWYMIFTEIF